MPIKNNKIINPRQQKFIDLYCSGMSGSEAYRQAGYKSKRPDIDSYKLRENPIIHQLIEDKKSQFTKSVDDKLAFEEDGSLEKLVQIRDMPISKDSIFAIIKACVEIIEHKRGKPKQQVDMSANVTAHGEMIVLDASGN